jgi:precorrin-3B synthase
MKVGEKFCPGILHAVAAKDGLLLRIRVPGGLIAGRQLRALSDLCEAFADGQIEITSRANIQLRAVRPENLAHIVEGLKTAGLFPSATHDRIRNLVASPLAGLDATELVDARPLLRELDTRLMADTRLMDLHPKFSFGIDGGGRRFSQSVDDVSLQAISAQAEPRFQLFIGGRDSGFGVAFERAVECMIEAARACLRVAREFDVPVRGKSVVAMAGAMEIVTRQLASLLVPSPIVERAMPCSEAPIGVHPSRTADRVCLIPSVPLGRMTAAQGRSVAEMAMESGDDIRLAPWRGIVLGSIPAAAADVLTKRLHAAGLSMYGRDGYLGVAACAGVTGCESSLADVRGDAQALAVQLRGREAVSGWSVNLSGCEKRCAMRHAAVVDVVADSLGYSLKIHGALVLERGSSASIMDAILSTHAGMIAEVHA